MAEFAPTDAPTEPAPKIQHTCVCGNTRCQHCGWGDTVDGLWCLKRREASHLTGLPSLARARVWFKFPELVWGSEGAGKMLEVLGNFNSMDGITAQFGPAGSKALCKAEFLAAVEWPDRSNEFTHCLLVIADDIPSLKAYLHSDFHLVDWMAAVGPFAKGIVVFDSDLALTLAPGDETILHTALFKMPGVVDGDAAHVAMCEVVAQFNDVPGVRASFQRAGNAALSKDELLEAVSWPDKAFGFTHLLTVVCDDAAALKVYLHGDAHKAWVGVAGPNMSGEPRSLIFDTPLLLSAAPSALRPTVGPAPKIQHS